MAKEQANFRIDADIKAEAYSVLARIGVKPTDAVNMFMHHIALFGALPFTPRVPNATTRQVFADTDAGRNLIAHDDVDAVFDTL